MEILKIFIWLIAQGEIFILILFLVTTKTVEIRQKNPSPGREDPGEGKEEI